MYCMKQPQLTLCPIDYEDIQPNNNIFKPVLCTYTE